MANFPLIRGRRIRATKTDGCGNVLLGPDSTIVSKGFANVTLTPNNTTTDAVQVPNADGENIIDEEAESKFSSYGVSIGFVRVEPELFSMFTGMPLVLDAAGTEAVGFDVDSEIDIDMIGAALEAWSKVPAGRCDALGHQKWGYFLLPFMQGGTLGGITIENGAVSFTIENMVTKDHNDWGVGPYDVDRDAAGVPGPMNSPISETTHLRLIEVSLDPPEETDGPEALGVPATGATAGSPATLTPTNSYAPADLTDAATGFTASPLTAWTTGQYVPLRDGTQTYWDGDSWNAGVAP